MKNKHAPFWNLNRVLSVFGYCYYTAMLVVFAYLWLVTENRYIAESMFKVATEAGNSDVSGLGASQGMVAAAGLSGAQATNGYIASGDLLLQIEKEFDLANHYTSPPHDFVFRLKRGASIEERLRYYRKRITSHYDLMEGVTVVSVDTFDRDLSLRINRRILELTEEFINGINRRIAERQLSYYVGELERAEANVKSINEAILKMQDENRMVSPESAIATSMRVIDQMYAKTLSIESEMTTLLKDSPDSPRIEILRSQLDALNQTIDRERGKLSGDDQKRMNLFLMQYKDMQQRLEFALQLRNEAEMTLERNRTMGNQHSRFFILFQEPFRPEKHGLPRRPYATITIFVLGSLVFLILRALTFTLFERA